MITVAKGHHTAATTALVVLFWMVAGFVVSTAFRIIDPITPVGGVVAKVCAIIAIAFLYMRLAGTEATLDHALFVGAIWLLLATIAEIVVTERVGRGWFELLGSPDSALRNVLMVAWMASPALFARRQ